MRKIKRILLFLLVVFVLLWLRGGTYLRYDNSDLVIGKQFFFKAPAVKVSPIPEKLLGDPFPKRFNSAIITATFWDDGYGISETVTTAKIPKDSKFIITKVVYDEVYGFWESAFKTTNKFYVIEDEKRNESISFWLQGEGVVKFIKSN